MKKHILILALLAVFGLANGQTWRWAHSFGGIASNYGYNRNWIKNMAMDEEGNLYIIGSFGRNCRMDDSIRFPTPMTGSGEHETALIAKFAPDGSLVWERQMKEKDSGAEGYSMEIKGDRLYIMANIGMYNMADGEYMIYWDSTMYRNTLINIPDSERTLPFIFGHWTALITADLDGNIIDNHFVRMTGGSFPWALCGFSATDGFFLHVDDSGDMYTFSNHTLFDSIDVRYLVYSDNDYSKSTTIQSNAIKHNVLLTKYAPDGTPLWCKWMFQHSDIEADRWSGPISRLQLTGFASDESGNMYVCGQLTTRPIEEYPRHIYFDEAGYHNIRIDHEKQYERGTSFIVKYDKNGNVLWTNQPYSTLGSHDQSYGNAWFHDCKVADSSVYILYSGGSNLGARVYFDNDTSLHLPMSDSWDYAASVGFLKLDQATGRYVTHCRVEGGAGDDNGLAIANNKVFIFHPYGPHNHKDSIHATIFSTAGTLISTTPIVPYHSEKTKNIYPSAVDSLGHLAIAFAIQDIPDFTLDTLHFPGKNGIYNVCFAMAYDSLMAAPYEIPYHKLRAVPNVEGYGTVTGSGRYHENTRVRTTATPAPGYHFVNWTDGDDHNPRMVCVSKDTTVVAVFKKDGGNPGTRIDTVPAIPFTLTPNPAHDQVAITCQQNQAQLTLHNAMGHEVLRTKTEQGRALIPLKNLPAGVYFVTLTTPEGSSTQRLVVE